MAFKNHSNNIFFKKRKSFLQNKWTYNYWTHGIHTTQATKESYPRKYRQNSSQNSLGPSHKMTKRLKILFKKEGDRSRKPEFSHGTQIRIEISMFHVKHQYFYFLSSKIHLNKKVFLLFFNIYFWYIHRGRSQKMKGHSQESNHLGKLIHLNFC